MLRHPSVEFALIEPMPSLQTPRLELRPATIATLRADLAGRDALADALDVDVPSSWPPEFYDADAVQWMIDQIERGPEPGDYGAHYLIRRASEAGTPKRALLIGAGGFRGPPTDAGDVEIGYSVVAEHQRQGYATEAVEAWVARAFEDAHVHAVVGQTLDGLTASIRVLERAGFTFVGGGEDAGAPEGESVIRYERHR